MRGVAVRRRMRLHRNPIMPRISHHFHICPFLASRREPNETAPVCRPSTGIRAVLGARKYISPRESELRACAAFEEKMNMKRTLFRWLSPALFVTPAALLSGCASEPSAAPDSRLAIPSTVLATRAPELGA